MQVRIVTTSSMLDERTVLIETKVASDTEQGPLMSSARVAYDVDELLQNRYLSGDLQDRIEGLRKSAENVAGDAIKRHFKILRERSMPVEPQVELNGLPLRASALPQALAIPATEPAVEQPLGAADPASTSITPAQAMINAFEGTQPATPATDAAGTTKKTRKPRAKKPQTPNETQE